MFAVTSILNDYNRQRAQLIKCFKVGRKGGKWLIHLLIYAVCKAQGPEHACMLYLKAGADLGFQKGGRGC